MHVRAASGFLSIGLCHAGGCTVDVGSAPDELVIDSQSEAGITGHLVGSHPLSIEVDARTVLVEDGSGAPIASLAIDPVTGIATGSFGARRFGGDQEWRDTAPWQEVVASPVGDRVRAAGSAAERLLDDDPDRAGSVELAMLAGLDDTLDHLAGVDSPAVPQDSCTDYWGCYNLWCTGYYYDWFWDPHSESWQCSWYPMVSCDWCPWI